MRLYRAYLSIVFHSEHDKADVRFDTFPILRETPCGYWIMVNAEKFVLKGNGKRYAYETKEWALESLYRRTLWRHYYAHLEMRRAATAYKYVHEQRPLGWPAAEAAPVYGS